MRTASPNLGPVWSGARSAGGPGVQRVTAQSGVQGCEMTTGVRAEMTTCVTGLPPEMTTGVTGEMTTGDKGLPSEMKIGNMELSYEMTSDMVLPQERTTGDTRLPCQALPERWQAQPGATTVWLVWSSNRCSVFSSKSTEEQKHHVRKGGKSSWR